MSGDHMHLPPVEKTWSIGTVLASVSSLFAMLAVLGTLWWQAAGYAGDASRVPKISSTQAIHSSEIAVIQDQQKYNNQQFQQILEQIRDVNLQLRQLNKEIARNGQH